MNSIRLDLIKHRFPTPTNKIESNELNLLCPEWNDFLISLWNLCQSMMLLLWFSNPGSGGETQQRNPAENRDRLEKNPGIREAETWDCKPGTRKMETRDCFPGWSCFVIVSGCWSTNGKQKVMVHLGYDRCCEKPGKKSGRNLRLRSQPICVITPDFHRFNTKQIQCQSTTSIPILQTVPENLKTVVFDFAKSLTIKKNLFNN